MLYTMFNIYQKMVGVNAIALTLLAGIFVMPLNAQDTVLGEDIEAEENLNWTFTSENEPITVEDDIRELKTYSLSDEDEDIELQLEEEDRKWGNRGDIEDYTFEVEVYDY